MSMTVARYSHPSQVPMYVMSPHQRALTLLASAVKSRRIRSAQAAAAGSAMVVFFHRFGARLRDPGGAHQPGDALAAMAAAAAGQLGVHPRRAVAALGLGVDGRYLRGQPGVRALAR
jgi:hypothetical protein